MADLAARHVLEGFDLPVTIGGVTLAAAADAPLFSVAPFRGRAGAVAAALGVDLPPPGRAADPPTGGRLIWAGLDLWLLRGPAADPTKALAGLAAVTDQSDGWTTLVLSGAGACDVLARLAPIDLDPAAFPPDAVARTQLKHMICLLARTAEGFEIAVMRSFALTAVHDLQTAMRRLAARAALA